MELIDYKFTHQQSSFQSKFFHISNQLYKVDRPDHNFMILAKIPFVNFQTFRLFVKIKFDCEKQTFKLQFQLLDKTIFKISNHFQKIFQIRKVLHMSSIFKDFILKIHPIAGQLSIQRILLINSLTKFQNINHFYDLLENLIEINLQIVKFLIINILYNFSEMIQNPKYCKINFKNYLLHSSCYTWKLLEGITSKSLKLQKYEEMRENFQNNVKKVVQNKYGCLDSIYGTLNLRYDFYELDKYTDQQIKNYFFPSLDKLINQNSNLIDQKINFNKQSIEYLKIKKQGKINTGNQIYKLRIHQYKQSEKFSLLHQKKILSKLPNHEMIGLPKYYFPKKIEKKLYLLTNLYNSLTLDKYLQRNKESISIFTKMTILNQIIITLQYLRNNKIVSNNLKFQNIWIKENNIVKLSSYINSHHQQIQRPIYKNSFPYYFKDLNPNNVYNNEDQRLDVLSFSFVLYFMIFQKPIIKIKDSNLQQINKNFQLELIISKKKYYFDGCKQFGDVILKYVQFLSLRGYCFPFEGEQFGDRPYLDWLVILMKFLKQYFEGLVTYMLPYRKTT